MGGPRRRTASSNHDEIRVLQNGSIEIRDLINERTAQAKADVDGLKELVLEKFDGVNIRFDAQKEALVLAHSEAEKNYRNLNDLREKCVIKDTYDQGHKGLEARLGSVELAMASRESLIQTIGAQGARLDTLERAASKQEGNASQSAVVGAYIFAGVGWVVGPLIALAIERMTR